MCVFLGRQGPPRPARRCISENKHVFLFSTTHAHIRARGPPPRQVAERGASKPQTHTTRRSLYSPIARASRARSCERPPSVGSEGAAWRAKRRGEKDREHVRIADRNKGNSGLPVASPHAACATPCAVCVTRPLFLRAPRPPAISGSGANGARARAEQGGGGREAQDGRSREPGPRVPRARGARTPHAPRASRRALRAPCARAWCARPGARRSEGDARAKRRNRTQQRQNRATNRRAKYGPRAPRALGARIPYAPCASRRASRAPRARSRCARPRRRATEREKNRREESTTRATSVLNCGGENHL